MRRVCPRFQPAHHRGKNLVVMLESACHEVQAATNYGVHHTRWIKETRV